MNPDVHDCCCSAGKMCEGRHDFMARIGNEMIVIKDVPALICDTCGEVEYTREVSREIDVIMKEFFAGRLRARPWRRGRSYSSPSASLKPDRPFSPLSEPLPGKPARPDDSAAIPEAQTTSSGNERSRTRRPSGCQALLMHSPQGSQNV